MELPENALTLYPNMDSLIKAIATCSVILKFEIEPGEEMGLDIEYRMQPLKFTPKVVLNYIWNIPSDYFRILNPKKIYTSDDSTTAPNTTSTSTSTPVSTSTTITTTAMTASTISTTSTTSTQAK